MKKWLLLSLVLIVVVVSILVIRGRLDTPKPVVYGSLLVRVPNSAYKYSLCSEAFSFAKAPANNPYKTDFTFHDPFRKAMDTIIPRFLVYANLIHIVSLSLELIINQVP